MSAVDLIIFDCDGVLVDSEPLSMRVLLAAIAAQGIEIPAEVAYRDFLGRSLSSISASLAESHGMPLGNAALSAMRSDLFALYRQELRPNPGLPDIFPDLDIPFCVASSSNPERIRISLELTNLSPWFEDRVFSSTMVEHGKPAPDLFLHAARTLGVAPIRCLVIEDSPAGIIAAQRAGMTVFGYLGGSHVVPSGLRTTIEALAPDVVFDDMHALPNLVRSLRTEKKAL